MPTISTLGATPDVTLAFTLNIGNVNEAPAAANDTNADDPVVEDTRDILGIVTDAGDPNATGNVLTNDSDPENDTLSVVGVAAGTPGSAPGSGVSSAIIGTYGSPTIAADGTWNYLLDNDDLHREPRSASPAGHRDRRVHLLGVRRLRQRKYSDASGFTRHPGLRLQLPTCRALRLT